MKRQSFLNRISISAVGASLAIAAGMAPASAMSLVPQQEGEVNVGLGNSLAGSYLTTSGFTVESLVDSSNGTKSRLFVDRAGTNNTYGGVKFQSTDVGTADKSNAYWFRPVAMKADGRTTEVENGQLEVGTYKFSFNSQISQMVLRLFDTETAGTRYSLDGSNWTNVTPGSNNNIFEAKLSDVRTLFLDLGQRALDKNGNKVGTGDGVNFQLDLASSNSSAAPEPATMTGIALAGAGFAAARRRRKTA